jgi:hypothetical protein
MPDARISATQHLLDNAYHWRKRAEEALANADQLTDPAAHAMMLDIVAGYEKLAQRAERRLALNSSGEPTSQVDRPADR